MSKGNIPLFVILFKDGTKYNGGNLKQTKWLQIPNNKNIQSLYYRLPTNDYLTLSKYDAYYHFVEATKDVSPSKNSKERIQSINLLCRKGKNVVWYKINLQKNVGSIETKIINMKNDIIKGLNPSGWKKGRTKNERK